MLLQKCWQISRAVHNSQNVDPVFDGPVQDQDPLESADAKDPSGAECGILELRKLSHLGLRREEGERLVSGY
jgi:hypothetical protein